MRDHRADAGEIVGSEGDANRFDCGGICGEAKLGKSYSSP